MIEKWSEENRMELNKKKSVVLPINADARNHKGPRYYTMVDMIKGYRAVR